MESEVCRPVFLTGIPCQRFMQMVPPSIGSDVRSWAWNIQHIQNFDRDSASVADHEPFFAKCNLGCDGRCSRTFSFPIHVISKSLLASKYSVKYFELSAYKSPYHAPIQTLLLFLGKSLDNCRQRTIGKSVTSLMAYLIGAGVISQNALNQLHNFLYRHAKFFARFSGTLAFEYTLGCLECCGISCAQKVIRIDYNVYPMFCKLRFGNL